MIVSAQEARLVLSTAGSREEAESIAESLVEQGLAGCVSLVPGLTSIYRWRGAIERSEEILLMIKTTAQRIPALEAAIRRIHSFEVPEVLVFAPECGAEDYLNWLSATPAKEK